MARLLVIGGTGFFGKSILDLYQRGGLAPWDIDHVVAMARNAERLREEPRLLPGVSLVSSDIATCDSVPEADYVIHAAASTDVRNYLAQPEQERRNIQAGTLNYCRLAKRHHRDSKIVFCSSGAVYGNQQVDFIDEDAAGTDVMAMAEGKRDYALAKRDAEAAVRELGLNVAIARCFAFVGPYLPRDQHFAIGNFIGDALAGRPVTVKARHAVYRSYLYADDLVTWLMAIAAAANPQCPTFNVGSDQPVLMGELAREVARVCGATAEVPAIDSAVVDRYVPSVARIREQLGVRIHYNLTEAIGETVRRLQTP